MALYLCLNENGSSAVTDDNPISTKHTNAGNEQTIEVYIANDGMRKGVQNDDPEKNKLIYTNIQIRVEGVSHTLEKELPSTQGSNTLVFDKIDGWNIGTIIGARGERMRISSILTENSISVERNYNQDGKGQSIITNHPIKTPFVAEATSVALALPNPDNKDSNGSFKNGGEAIEEGIDPSRLLKALKNVDTDKAVRSNNASLYAIGSVIKIDNEKMKITATNAQELTVVRGFEGTKIENHTENSVIYCVGIVDIKKGHKFYIKNTPPPGLPTQKKSDIKIVLLSDEEPL